ncbi:MAG: response regulator transcription factor [Proteobacteria bacterium]|nr:response regulator transcription factor [Pseudomonadota bacterium]
MENSIEKRILLVEDDEHIAEGLKLNLTIQGYEVRIALDGSAGLREWKSWQPDLIVLDLMLPVIDGVSVLRNIRLEDERIPILVLSAKGASGDKVECFSYGVDDYLQKPFNLDEFLLRVERLLTRVSWNRESADAGADSVSFPVGIYDFGKNRIDFSTSIAHCNNGKVSLTEQEVKLLKLFISNRGKPLSRKKLLEIGWGYTGNTETRTVDNFIVRLRKYFEDNPKQPEYFKSIRSVGYMFDHG